MQTVQLFTLSNILLLLIVTTITAEAIEAGSINALQLTPFHPISRAEYEAILGLTNGQQTISEARLIASGIAALKGLITGLKAGLSGTFLASWVGAIPTSTTTFSDDYPLCVINAGKEPVIHQNGKQNYNPQDPYQINYEQQSEEQQQQDQPYSPYYEQQQTVSPSPLVNCIVVVKKKPEGEEQSSDMPAEASKPQPYNSWQQYRLQQHPEDPWYGYPSAAYYGYPAPPPPSQLYHRYRSSPIYHSYPSNNNGYQRFSAYQSYPEFAEFPPYSRQQSLFQVNEQQQPKPIPELTQPPASTTKAPTSPPTTTRKASTRRPHIHSLKPIKHLNRKRKRPSVAVQYDADRSSSAEAVDGSEVDAAPMQNSQHVKPNIQIHKIDPPYYAENDDQADSTETNTSHHFKAKTKRPTAATNYHSNQKKHSHRHHSARPEQVNQSEQVDSTETVSYPQYSGHKSQKHKSPTAEQISHTEDAVDSADSAEITDYTKYPKQDSQKHKHSKPAPSTYADNEDNDHEDRPDAEETASYPHYSQYPTISDYSSNLNTHHSKPTVRPANSANNKPRPHKANKRKHTKNQESLHSNEQISSPRPTASANKSKREKTTKYPHAAANYAELSEYPHDSYQPAPYPQLNYQTTYPKVSYTQAQSDPAPVYVRKTKIPSTTAPSTITEPLEFGIDSSESENSAEFIKVRQTDYDE